LSRFGHIIELLPDEKNLLSVRRKLIVKEYLQGIVIRNRGKNIEKE
jgi:hypothetical protein